MKTFLSVSLLLLCGVSVAIAADVKSPNGQVVLSFAVKDCAGVKDCPVYRVAFKGKPVIAESRLGFDLAGGAGLKEGLEILSIASTSHDSTWKPVYGRRSSIRDNYNQIVASLRQRRPPHQRVDLVFRCYDSGAALCYTIHKSGSRREIAIAGENTEFRFLGDHVAWSTRSAQGAYAKTTLSRIGPGAERPLTVKIDENTYVALAEARLVDFARMKLSSRGGKSNCIVSALSGGVNAPLPVTTPWRVIMLAESPGRLLENSHIILNLNEPCAIKDPSWIRPGKVIREVTLTTAGGKACVDFAARHNLQFVEFDAGWYGHEYDGKSDATTVTVDPRRSPGPLDLHEVVRYASRRGVGIILYVNRRALERQIDEVLPLYAKWGISGVKYGFVNVGSQRWTSWLHAAVRKAARHKLMVDVHDEYRPTGYSRTYPNLMTQEGIRGDEAKPSNELTLTILFTRMLAGAADNTICYYDSRVDRNATHAYQLAKAVCIYSPWQFMYWYDRPAASPQRAGGAGGQKGAIGDEPELEFFDSVPTVWDDTKVIHGRIGEYAVIARRRGRQWFIGCMNSGKARTLNIPLGFLPKGTKYVAHVYSDDPTVKTRTHVRIRRFLVGSDTVLKAEMTAKGGQAVRITPAAG